MGNDTEHQNKSHHIICFGCKK